MMSGKSLLIIWIFQNTPLDQTAQLDASDKDAEYRTNNILIKRIHLKQTELKHAI